MFNLVTGFIVFFFFTVGYFIGGYRGAKLYQKTVGEDISVEITTLDHHVDSLKLILQREDPESYIIEDLMGRPDLIKEEPVLGGTMGFYHRENIQLITDRWVLAWYEDGHIGGYSLLEFSVKEDKSLTWSVVSSYLE